jgi:hypothetical protein
MYPINQAVGAARIKEWHEQAARDRLVTQARRARREAATANPGQARPRLGFRWLTRRAPSGAAVPGERPMPPVPVPVPGERPMPPVPVPVPDERAGAAGDRQPVGGRAA